MAKTPAQISQRAIAFLKAQREKIAKLSETLKEKEIEMLAALKSGAEVQNGKLKAEVKSWERRSPKWKAVVERELGEDYAARVLAGTPPDTFEKLEIS